MGLSCRLWAMPTEFHGSTDPGGKKWDMADALQTGGCQMSECHVALPYLDIKGCC